MTTQYYGPTRERFPDVGDVRELNREHNYSFHVVIEDDPAEGPLPPELRDSLGEPDSSTLRVEPPEPPLLPWLTSVDGSGQDTAAGLLWEIERELQCVPGTSLVDAVEVVLTILRPSAERAAECLAALCQAGLNTVLRYPPRGVQAWELLALISEELSEDAAFPDTLTARTWFFRAARSRVWGAAVAWHKHYAWQESVRTGPSPIEMPVV